MTRKMGCVGILVCALVACAGNGGRSGEVSGVDHSRPEAVEESTEDHLGSPVARVSTEANEPLRQRTFDVLSLGDHVVRGGSLGVIVESIQDPASPRELGLLVLPGSVNGLELLRPGLIAAGCGSEGIFFVDISTPSAPRKVGELQLDGAVWRLHRQGELLLIAAGHQGVVVSDGGGESSWELVIRRLCQASASRRRPSSARGEWPAGSCHAGFLRAHRSPAIGNL